MNNDNEIDNLLEDNINLMIEIDNILDKNDKQIDNIVHSNNNINDYNQISNYYLNRMNNFFFRLYSSLVGKKNPNLKAKSIEYNDDINNSNSENNNEINNNILNVMKQKSQQISLKIDKQNDKLSDINHLIEINDYKTKKNTKIADQI